MDFHTLTLNLTPTETNPADCYFKCAYPFKFLHTKVIVPPPSGAARPSTLGRKGVGDTIPK